MVMAESASLQGEAADVWSRFAVGERVRIKTRTRIRNPIPGQSTDDDADRFRDVGVQGKGIDCVGSHILR